MPRGLYSAVALCLVLSGCGSRVVVRTVVERCPPALPELRCVEPERPTSLKKIIAALRKCAAVDTAVREAWEACGGWKYENHQSER